MKTQEADPLSATNRNLYLDGAALTINSCGELNGGSSVLNLGEYGIFCVADGVGDPIGGKKASEEIVEAIEQKFWDTKFEDEKGVLATVKEALGRAKIKIIRIAQDHQMGKMGASVAILHLNPIKKSAFIIHAGNSRVYRFRDGSLTKLTEDHSVAAEMGLSDDDDISHIVQENLTRAVGLFGRTNLETTSLDFLANDFYLICSHGLTKSLEHSEICEILNSHRQSDVNVVINQLSDRTKQAEFSENVSLVLVKIVEEKTPEEIVQKKKSLPIPIPILLGIATVFVVGLFFLLSIGKTKDTSIEVSENQVLNRLPIQKEDTGNEAKQSHRVENESPFQLKTATTTEMEKSGIPVVNLESTPKPVEDTSLANDESIKELTPPKENEVLVKNAITQEFQSDKSDSNPSKNTASDNLENVESKQLNLVDPSAQESLKPIPPQISLGSKTQTQIKKSIDNPNKIRESKGPNSSEIALFDEMLTAKVDDDIVAGKIIPPFASAQSQKTKKSNSDDSSDKISLDNNDKERRGDASVAINLKETVEVPLSPGIEVNTILKDFEKILENKGLAAAMNQVEDKWQSMTLDEKEPLRNIIMKNLIGSSLKSRNNNYENGDETWEILKMAPTIKDPNLSLHMRKLLRNFENDFSRFFNQEVIQAQRACQWEEIFTIIENNPTISRDLISVKMHCYIDVWSELSSTSSNGIKEIKNFLERAKLVSHNIQPLLEGQDKDKIKATTLAEMELPRQVEICQQFSQIRNDLHQKLNEAIERLNLNLSIIDTSSLELLIHSAYPKDVESIWKDKRMVVVKTGINQLKKLKNKLNPKDNILSANDEVAVFEQIAEEIVPLLEEVQDHLLFVSILVKKIKQVSENEGQLIVADMNLINDFSSQFTNISSIFPTEIARNLNQRFSQSIASGN